MSSELFLGFFAIQFVVQTILYFQIARRINKMITKCKWFSLTQLKQIINIAMIVENILISMLVMAFTAAGAASGLSNLGASCLLGVIMYFDSYIILADNVK